VLRWYDASSLGSAAAHPGSGRVAGVRPAQPDRRRAPRRGRPRCGRSQPAPSHLPTGLAESRTGRFGWYRLDAAEGCPGTWSPDPTTSDCWGRRPARRSGVVPRARRGRATGACSADAGSGTGRLLRVSPCDHVHSPRTGERRPGRSERCGPHRCHRRMGARRRPPHRGRPRCSPDQRTGRVRGRRRRPAASLGRGRPTVGFAVRHRRGRHSEGQPGVVVVGDASSARGARPGGRPPPGAHRARRRPAAARHVALSCRPRPSPPGGASVRPDPGAGATFTSRAELSTSPQAGEPSTGLGACRSGSR